MISDDFTHLFTFKNVAENYELKLAYSMHKVNDGRESFSKGIPDNFQDILLQKASAFHKPFQPYPTQYSQSWWWWVNIREAEEGVAKACGREREAWKMTVIEI